MKRMSFRKTTRQFRERSKDVTRRLGWSKLKAGEQFLGVEKAMGLKPGEKQIALGAAECVSNRPEPLNAITQEDVIREGFPEMTPAQFVAFFCESIGATPETIVNRIVFKYLEAAR